MTDCTVIMTLSAYVPPPPYGWSKASSSAGDFRQLTPLVLMDALDQAGTIVYEPVGMRLRHLPPVHGAPPTRPRTDANPLNRQEYLMRVAHRV